MEPLPRRRVVGIVVGIAVATVVGAAVFGGSQPVRAENVSCETGTNVRCTATLVNENDDTGYDLAVTVIGYGENGDVVATFTDDATTGGDGIASIRPGGSKTVKISTSSSERVVEGDVRVTDVEPVDG